LLKDSIFSATETIVGATSAIGFVLQTPIR